MGEVREDFWDDPKDSEKNENPRGRISAIGAKCGGSTSANGEEGREGGREGRGFNVPYNESSSKVSRERDFFISDVVDDAAYRAKKYISLLATGG